MTGSVFAACTSETRTGAFGASTTSHCAPTVCIHVPTQLTSTPSHSQRKADCRSGAQIDATGADGSAAPVTVASRRIGCR
jgi:hypothetical protein